MGHPNIDRGAEKSAAILGRRKGPARDRLLHAAPWRSHPLCGPLGVTECKGSGIRWPRFAGATRKSRRPCVSTGWLAYCPRVVAPWPSGDHLHRVCVCVLHWLFCIVAGSLLGCALVCMPKVCLEAQRTPLRAGRHRLPPGPRFGVFLLLLWLCCATARERGAPKRAPKVAEAAAALVVGAPLVVLGALFYLELRVVLRLLRWVPVGAHGARPSRAHAPLRGVVGLRALAHHVERLLRARLHLFGASAPGFPNRTASSPYMPKPKSGPTEFDLI